MTSIWVETAARTARGKLERDLQADVAVIGGGMAGILTAYLLSRAGFHTVVLEANCVGSGQTSNTTAKITAQHGLIYHKLLNTVGEKKAALYARANQNAIQQYAEIIKREKIDCDFKICPAYLYARERDVRIHQEYEAAKKLGIDADYVMDTELPFRITGAVRFRNQAQFHPLKFLYHVADLLEIYEHTRVQKIEGNRIITDGGTVSARQIVISTHYPFINFPGLYFTKMHQERSYVLAVKGAQEVQGMYYGIGVNDVSLRSYRDYLLIGGGSHRTGENIGGGQYDRLRGEAWKYWPECKEVYHWSAQDDMTADEIPYIGKYSWLRTHWYVTAGFKKWGMTGSMVAAQLVCDEITGKENPYRHVFRAKRCPIPHGMSGILTEMIYAVKGIGGRIFKRADASLAEIKVGHGGIVAYEGKKMGAYRDHDGTVYLVSVKCPHLGCMLQWNAEEKSWDCPCHGSRFDYKGRLLDNPAQISLEAVILEASN
ncbi:MAG: FAD-dependent oxidoreductase [Lachnospiraceae bacterium]|nr:FAD-dependent oxidoreductase [Lachnospiraceae bacterium]